MKERPILFSAPMVRAILEGRKTQTRRVCKRANMGSDDAPIWAASVHPASETGWIAWQGLHADRPEMAEQTKRLYREGFTCPYGQPGDRLWVRETWSKETIDGCLRTVYRADIPNGQNFLGWKPSIHMPRTCSRITLEITDVRVDRVESITTTDAYAEGCGREPCAACDESGAWPDGSICEDCSGEGWHSERDVFRKLWDTINAKRGYGWDTNPWVWCMTFTRVQP